MRRITRLIAVTAIAGLFWQGASVGTTDAQAGEGWRGKRPISYQDPQDLFYNSYVGPQPSGTAAEMYVSPLPVPAYVGHTYTTYQPLMPHEYLYGHNRSWYTHAPGAGWTRTKVRYSTFGGMAQRLFFKYHK